MELKSRSTIAWKVTTLVVMIVHLTFEGEFIYNDKICQHSVRANYKFIIYYPLYLWIGSNENKIG